MTSTDRYIVIDGRIYQAVDNAPDEMSDSEFKREVIRRLDGVDTRLGKLESRVGVIERDLTIANHDIGHVQTSVYWGFALLALVVAFVSWFRPRDDAKPETQSVPSRWELEGMIRDVVREMLPHVNS